MASTYIIRVIQEKPILPLPEIIKPRKCHAGDYGECSKNHDLCRPECCPFYSICTENLELQAA
ncbi:MAG: hypothetical protein U9Q21_02550 [Candidatus Auribacterota bacterium]|nr:hypothetical protein [Candidatus Auribacterota bacterium]